MIVINNEEGYLEKLRSLIIVGKKIRMIDDDIMMNMINNIKFVWIDRGMRESWSKGCPYRNYGGEDAGRSEIRNQRSRNYQRLSKLKKG